MDVYGDQERNKRWVQLPLFPLSEAAMWPYPSNVERHVSRTENQLQFNRKEGGWFFSFLAGFFDGRILPEGYVFESIWIGPSWRGWQVVLRCKQGARQQVCYYQDTTRGRLLRGLQWGLRHGELTWREGRAKK